jgi:putative DNA-invertase from lambdoid prophage Rac
MKTVLYCRVSTVDQTLDHQVTQAKAAGFAPDVVLADHGISGVSTRLSERPEGRRLFDILRERDILVVRWIDRLGRNYTDVTDTVREFIRRGIRIETVINRMSFDGTTKDPMRQAIRDSLVGFMAAMAQSQAEVTKESQKAGIAHAKKHDDGTKYRGRKPTFTCDQFFAVQRLLSQGTGVSAVSKTTGVKRQSVYRIQTDPQKQLAALRAWHPDEFVEQSSAAA